MASNKTALITGGTKGIGLAIAKSFLQEGINICITGRNQESIDQIIKQLGEDQKIIGIQADVRNREQMESVVSQCLNTFNRIDYVIANAGVGHFKSIEEMTYEQWNETIDINLTGVFNTLKPSIPSLKSSKGYFISIASLAGTNFFANGSSYNASKFGLVGFTQAVMLDLRKHGIKVSTIMPGSVSTYFNNRTPGDNDGWKIQPEDIGQICVDLIKMPGNTLPSKIEVRPTQPPVKS